MADASSDVVVVDLITPPPSPRRIDDANATHVKAEAGPSSGDASDGDASSSANARYDSDVEEVHVDKKQRTQCEVVDADSDDDFQVTGESGDVAGRDFPHARHNCIVHPFAKGSKTSCNLCFCWVCDCPVGECPAWDEHHAAVPSSSEWQQKRTAFRAQTLSGLPGNPLKLIRQVYDNEADVPGLARPLHAAQRQMLAFALHVETQGVSTRLFEDSTGQLPLLPKTHGGFIAAQMGLGKTGLIIALIKSRPMLTLVVVPPQGGCVGQWVDQFRIFTPDLNVARLYCERQEPVLQNIDKYHAIVISAGSKLLDGIAQKVKRVVVDESHLLLGGCKLSCGSVMRFVRNQHTGDYPNVKHGWCVSGTPFTEFNDECLVKQAMFVLRRNKIRLNYSATLSDAKAIMIRLEKDQQIAGADGSMVQVANIPSITYDTLQCTLTADELALYKIAGCVDAWSNEPLHTRLRDMSTKYATSALVEHFELRQLVLGEQFPEFRKRIYEKMDAQMYCPDSMPVHEFYSIRKRMEYTIDTLVDKMCSKNSKIDAVLHQIQTLQASSPEYKAVIVSESEGAGRYILQSPLFTGKVGVMQRKKGQSSKRMEQTLSEFQKGQYTILVCSYEMVEVGINLDQAGHMFFVDSTVEDTKNQQACARIARFGVKHAELRATFVYVANTVSETIFEFHKARREGKSFHEAVKLFADDAPHSFGDPVTTYRAELEDTNDCGDLLVTRVPKLIEGLFTADDIDEAFEKALGGPSDPVEIDEQTSVLSVDMRKNVYQPVYNDRCTSLQIRIKRLNQPGVYAATLPKGADGIFSLTVNDLPEWIPSRVKLTKDNIRLVLPNGSLMTPSRHARITKYECCHCSVCSWRTVSSSETRIVGSYLGGKTSNGVPISISELYQYTSTEGVLKTKEVMYAPALDIDPTSRRIINKAEDDEFRAFKDEAKTHRPTAHGLHYKTVNEDYFEQAKYTKVHVELSDATTGDTVRFSYDDKDYTVFVHVIVPVPDPTTMELRWYTTALIPHVGSDTIRVAMTGKMSIMQQQQQPAAAAQALPQPQQPPQMAPLGGVEPGAAPGQQRTSGLPMADLIAKIRAHPQCKTQIQDIVRRKDLAGPAKMAAIERIVREARRVVVAVAVHAC